METPNPSLIARLIAYNAQQRITPVETPTTPPNAPPTPPVVVLPPTIPPAVEPHAWQRYLTDEQRTLYSRAKAHELSGVEGLILKLGELLDAEYNKL